MTVPGELTSTPAGARPVRHFEMPSSLGGRLRVLRYSIARRVLQFGVLLAFYGTLHWGWKALGAPLLAGNLSAASVAAALPLADPLAVLQMLVGGHWLATEVLVGATVTLAFYAIVGGRVFCAWVCPMNIVTDAAFWLRSRFGIGAGEDLLRIPPRSRYVVLALALLLSAASGVAAFEWFSPIAMLHRELIYGAGLGLTAALGIFLLDALALRHGWCGHLCPLGAFWTLVGRAGQVRVAFNDASCTRCGDCVKVCPEPRVLHFGQAAARGMIASGECTNCGRCVAICPESSLAFALRARIHPQPAPAASGAEPIPGGPR
jgi:ferredoxin-type protein NapH